MLQNRQRFSTTGLFRTVIMPTLGVEKQAIVITDRFPWPLFYATTNDVVHISIRNNLREPFLMIWKKAGGGCGAIRVNNREVIPLPLDQPYGDLDILVANWYNAFHWVDTYMLNSLGTSTVTVSSSFGEFHFLVIMEQGIWNKSKMAKYNMVDAVSRSTVQVYPFSWTAIVIKLDNQAWVVEESHITRAYTVGFEEGYIKWPNEEKPKHDPSGS
ncbi:hypothetical protein FEM48_Zijuj06G0017900 [Ziziphus jujuba var. spinosa]|uniref:Monocopper oxidase-like protein SKU5 n=1 Tax=Ziziphus jujuba var. spinosa TaxID=714518 RepID=A0A978V6G6_ZIZJJ|nr:hypothetical protein FEM48_Zijuj06G0017900 [Ziziphus jujuba var. spinosa]